ncbi:MAG TPA: thiol reductant ABC exporter subunit CydD [Ktedonobacter sp.]|nr:thiol reductant ABC exporter subunit CydD [Ktedonobacter sp.]
MSINKRLLQYVKTMYLYVAAVGILGFLTVGCIIVQAYLIAHIVNGAFLLKQTLVSLQAALFILLAVLAIRAIVLMGGDVITNAVSCSVKSNLRSRLFSHLFALGPLYTRGERSGEIVNTTADGVESLDAYFIQFFPQVAATLIIPTVVLIVVFRFDLISGIVLLVTWPILPLFMILIGIQANAMTKRRWQVVSLLSAHFLDVLQGLTTLKLFGRITLQEETIRRVSERYSEITLNVLKVAFLSSFVMETGATLSTAIVAVEIGLRLLYGSMPFEPAFFILLLAPEFFLPLRSLGTQFHASINSAASAGRIFDILETSITSTKTPITSTSNNAAITIQNTLAFHNVSYTYPSTDDTQTGKVALKGVSFDAQRGQMVALVGASGAGKTTIANLLLRFMKPTGGEITVDGRPIQNVTAQEWRQHVAWQPQNPYVFNATVAENIRLGRANASMQEVIEAALAADIHGFIMSLPQGYETMIGERGARLSGGQIQRLSLARVFLKNAPVVVLDEATSTLDSESEEQVLRNIRHVMKDHIFIVIAHRLNTIEDADKIIVLQNGQVAAQGTHQDLMQQSTLYRNMVQAYEGKGVLL